MQEAAAVTTRLCVSQKVGDSDWFVRIKELNVNVADKGRPKRYAKSDDAIGVGGLGLHVGAPRADEPGHEEENEAMVMREGGRRLFMHEKRGQRIRFV
jgi:hypothetical protein